MVTCHNYARYLRECLDSILAQTWPFDAVLVVDDASDDETPAVCQEYAMRGVQYLRTEFRDVALARNAGIAALPRTPLQNRLMQTIIKAPIHIGCTIRVKMDYVLEEVEKNGRKVQQPKRVGLQPVQRDNTGYEFDFIFDVDMDHIPTVTKCPPIPDRFPARRSTTHPCCPAGCMTLKYKTLKPRRCTS